MALKSIYNDAQLLLMVQQSNHEAFEALYFRYFGPLCRYAFKKLPEEDVVEEIVQDVFIDLWHKRETLDPAQEIARLLYAMLRNKSLHELRARMIQNKHLEKFILLQPEYAEETTEQLYAKQMAEKIQSAVDRLSPQCRQAFILSRYEHLPYKDIAARMDISVNTVEKHLGKALMLLRLEFREYNMPVVLLIGLVGLALKA